MADGRGNVFDVLGEGDGGGERRGVGAQPVPSPVRSGVMTRCPRSRRRTVSKSQVPADCQAP